MPDSRRLDVEVELPEDQLGAFANAFRVLKGETPASCLLEFLLYSSTANRASVIVRVEVERDFLPVIRDRLVETLNLAEISCVVISSEVH